MADRHVTRVDPVGTTVTRFRPSCSCGWVGDRSRMTDACRTASIHYHATLTHHQEGTDDRP